MVEQHRILLVDDDADFVRITKSMLEKNGYAVTPAYNGQEAREKVKSERFDVIILDVMMETDTEGFHVAYDIRKDEAIKNVPLVMLTAINLRSSPAWKVTSDETWLPVDVFLDKPVTSAQLLAAVEKALGKTS